MTTSFLLTNTCICLQAKLRSLALVSSQHDYEKMEKLTNILRLTMMNLQVVAVAVKIHSVYEDIKYQ